MFAPTNIFFSLALAATMFVTKSRGTRQRETKPVGHRAIMPKACLWDEKLPQCFFGAPVEVPPLVF
ncbi:hypothetical protein KUV73_24685 [Mameliella alba]|nr:hypothetical protein [Mameliella alba]MBY6172603.1 hypothetical protein [Mameliella alba]MBY6177585.1 hypothetical protein [Mameliella alba]